MLGWVTLGCIAGGVICFVAAAESYYNDDEWMACGIILIILACVLGVVWGSGFVTGVKADKQVVAEQQSDAQWAKINYDKFVAKYKLSKEQFPRIPGESKAQVQTRIRNFITKYKPVVGKGVVPQTTQQKARNYVMDFQAPLNNNVSYSAEPEIKAPEITEDLGGHTFKTTW